MNPTGVGLICHGCGTRYQISNPARLRPRKKSTCRTCRLRFMTVTLPSNLDQAGNPSGATKAEGHEIPRQPSTEKPTGTRQRYRFAFHGMGSTLFGIQIVNVFLTLLTLGLFHFWAKVRVRKYLFSQMECAGDRLVYEGVGKELLIGFIRASVFFGIPYLALAFVPEFIELSAWGQAIIQWMAAGVIFLFIPIAVISARRYRLSRTSWRGIRFSFRGRAWDFLKLYVKGTVFSLLTLGVYYPYYQTQRQAFLISHSYLGNQGFNFKAHGSGLVPSFATTVVLAGLLALIAFNLPRPSFPDEWKFQEWMYFVLKTLWPFFLLLFTVGPLWVWFTAKKYQFFWNHTTFGSATFRSTVTGRSLLNLQVENFLLLILTLGFAWPWVMVRTQRFYADRLSLRGTVNLDDIQQDYQYVNPVGEGLASILDTGFEMD